jgi:hypothetical protein
VHQHHLGCLKAWCVRVAMSGKTAALLLLPLDEDALGRRGEGREACSAAEQTVVGLPCKDNLQGGGVWEGGGRAHSSSSLPLLFDCWCKPSLRPV